MLVIPRHLARLTAAAAIALLAGFVTAVPASGHGGNLDPAHVRSEAAAAQAVEPLISDNIELVSANPGTLGISGVFARSTEHFYVSGLESITVYDVSNPGHPAVTGKLDNLTFENEAMNYGERRNPRTGELRQFVLVGVDLHQASTEDPSHINPGDGAELVVVDVTDPTDPSIAGRIRTVPSTHTVACIQETSCRYAYSAGNGGRFSIFDLQSITRPVEVDAQPGTPGIQRFRSPALAPTEVFSNGAGHKWNFDASGLAFHTGAAGTAVFDVSRPRSPQLLTTTNDMGTAPGWNDFIHHNSFHPKPGAFRPGAPPALGNGNVLLVTEEDYENTDCATAGSFQTWRIGSLQRDDAVTPVDKVELADLGGAAAPHQGFCSAHWFDFHPKGIVAAGFYNGGLRLIDVRNPENIKPFGHAISGGETWDAYWVPKRDDRGRATGGSTNLVYSVDLLRGLDVYRVDLSRSAGPAPASMPGVAPTVSQGTAAAAVGIVGSGLVASFILFALRRRRHEDLPV